MMPLFQFTKGINYYNRTGWQKQSLPRHQAGAMSLLISLIILTLITMISLYTAHTVSMEQKISTNDYRSRIAFEAAEAGLESAVAYVDSQNGGADRDNSPTEDSVDDELIFNADGSVNVGTGTGTNNDRTFTDASGNAVSKVNVTMTGNSDLTEFTVTSVGETIDETAKRTITRVLAIQSPIPDVPGNAVTARGALGISGAATIHNPEGFSTILTGGDLDMGSNSATHTEIADDSHANYPACSAHTPCSADENRDGCANTQANSTGYVKCDVIEASNTQQPGVDVREHDATLASMSDEEFFEFIFGMKPSVYKTQDNVFHVDNADFDEEWTNDPPGVDLATYKVIWVDGNTNNQNSVTVGCSVSVNTSKNSGANPYKTMNCESSGGKLKPSIVIIDGDVTLKGGTKIFGLLFVMGDITVNGNVEVQGAVASQGDSVAVSGSLDIWYDSGILEDLIYGGSTSGTSGTWRDF